MIIIYKICRTLCVNNKINSSSRYKYYNYKTLNLAKFSKNKKF